MKLNLKFTGLDSTLAIKTYIEDAMVTLGKFLSRTDGDSVLADVELARNTNHHQKGDVYHAECNLVVDGKTLRVACEGSDPRVCIDDVVDRMKSEIKKMGALGRPQDSGSQEKLRKLRGKD
ncbi:MAG: HPF/RaiA family ribosome-associated protein [bacterium]|nr:HPF/RaiA family ribosome-associated protein [bacterium]